MPTRTVIALACLSLLAVPALAQDGTSPPAALGTSGAATSTTAASAPTRPAAASAAQSPDYRVGPGDKLRVEVYKDAQLSQSLQVRPDGKITLPLIGDLVAAGLTPLELRDRLTESLREYVTNPVVTVIVVEAVPPLVYVIGEVGNPGSIPMNGPMSVLQALAMAGGFRDFANTKKIQILRKTGRGQQRIAFNYKEALAATGPPMMLQPGDTIVVP